MTGSWNRTRVERRRLLVFLLVAATLAVLLSMALDARPSAHGWITSCTRTPSGDVCQSWETGR